MRQFTLIAFFFVFSCLSSKAYPSYTETGGGDATNNDSIKQVITQRAISLANYYINVVSSLEQSTTISFCESKKNEILNNLRISKQQELPELRNVPLRIIDILQKIKVNEMDREVYMQIATLKRKNQSLQAFSNALSTPMSIFNAGSFGLNSVLTLARAGVDLAVAKREQEMEDIQGMWTFDRNNIVNIDELTRVVYEAIIEIVNNNNYINKASFENGVLTQQKAKEYNNILSNTNPYLLVSSLESQKEKYKDLFDYYYHLGMGYVEQNQYEKAKKYFNLFLNQCDNTLFYKDSRIGMVALTKLLHEQKDLTKEEAERQINLMIGKKSGQGHIADNDMAYLVASATYLELAKITKDDSYKIKAYNCIYDGLDKMYNNNLNDASLVAAVMNCLDTIKLVDTDIHKKICVSILEKSRSLSPTDRVSILFSLKDDDMATSISQMFALEKNENSLSISLNVGQKVKLSMDTVCVYDFYFNHLNNPEIAEYTRLLRGKSKAEIKKEINDSIKDALTDASFKYFFTMVNPNNKKAGYCLLPGFNREDYLPGGKFEDKMVDVKLLMFEKGRQKATDELNLILDYCEKNVSDFSKLVCVANANMSKYKEASEK